MLDDSSTATCSSVLYAPLTKLLLRGVPAPPVSFESCSARGPARPLTLRFPFSAADRPLPFRSCSCFALGPAQTSLSGRSSQCRPPEQQR